MTILPWILLVISIGIIFFLLGKGQKTIYIDPESSEKAKYEEHYRKEREALDKRLTEERKVSIENIRKEEGELREKAKVREQEIYNKLEKQKQKILLDMEESLDLHRQKLENKKKQLNDLFEKEEIETLEKIEEFKILLDDWRSRQDAAVESAKREEKLREKDNFYKIVLSEEEIEELHELNKAIKKLRNPMPFRKAVYDFYYKPKINDLVRRITNNNKLSGIYKITHIESKKVYIGQSVDIGNRWKQHAKRGCGADQLTQNKLYPAMLKDGIESFTWEIIEEVEQEKLSEAEKYWQEYYSAKDFGYSMK